METGTPEEVPVVQEAREEDLELLPELVTHLRDRRTELREQWADRITNAHLLSAMTDEEIFSMATSVYDSYVEVLETGSVEALQAYARDLSERISVTAREQLSGASEVCRQARRKRAWARTIQPSRPQRHDALPKRSYWIAGDKGDRLPAAAVRQGRPSRAASRALGEGRTLQAGVGLTVNLRSPCQPTRGANEQPCSEPPRRGVHGQSGTTS